MDIATRIALLRLVLKWQRPEQRKYFVDEHTDGGDMAKEGCGDEILELLGVDTYIQRHKLEAMLHDLEAQQASMQAFLGAEGTQLDIC